MNAESVMKQTKPECELKKNSSETDFNEDDRRKMRGKMKWQRSSKQSNNKMPFSHHISTDTGVDLTGVFQEVRNKKQLAVRCGKMAGCLYRIKYDNGEKCISCKGKWFTPRQFEEFGGKKHYKKWKSSIYYKPSNGLQVKLLKLIQNGCLSEFGQQRESVRQVTQTDKDGANSVQNVTRTSSSSDESVSVAERVKMNRRESVILAKTVCKKITEPVESTASARDLPAPPSDATEPAVSSVTEEANQTTDEAASEAAKAAQLNFSDSPTDATESAESPVIEEADQTTDEPAAAAQLNISVSPAELQNPISSEETEKTGQKLLIGFLANQFNTINNTLKSIDLSLKKLVEKQNTLPQYISLTPAVIENPQIHSLVKEEQITVLNH
ncbi:nuclear autoantigen Sp-100-like protein [Labeo rohita]|nr:nuclear autoantigen Sp-100-like protein [Labeo rohita]